eukprot:2736725-Amphidinium_carterae.2
MTLAIKPQATTPNREGNSSSNDNNNNNNEQLYTALSEENSVGRISECSTHVLFEAKVSHALELPMCQVIQAFGDEQP